MNKLIVGISIIIYIMCVEFYETRQRNHRVHSIAFDLGLIPVCGVYLMATATEADSMQGEDGGGGWTGSVSGGALHLCAHILMFQVMFFKGIVKFQIN